MLVLLLLFLVHVNHMLLTLHQIMIPAHQELRSQEYTYVANYYTYTAMLFNININFIRRQVAS